MSHRTDSGSITQPILPVGEEKGVASVTTMSAPGAAPSTPVVGSSAPVPVAVSVTVVVALPAVAVASSSSPQPSNANGAQSNSSGIANRPDLGRIIAVSVAGSGPQPKVKA